MTRYSITKTIYSGKRKNFNPVTADMVSYMHTLNLEKMEEELLKGKRKLMGGYYNLRALLWI